MLFLLQGFQTTPWNTKDINIGGINLTNINFGNISNETKFINTLKYYQKISGHLAAILSVNEKLAFKEVAEQLIELHHYFSEVQKFLGPPQKEKTLNIVADGKGIIPYQKIVDTNSMSSPPENSIFFEKSEFYSNLKQKSVSDEDYDSPLYLYKTLKMRNLGDMNELYSTQDVILLCGIIENRF